MNEPEDVFEDSDKFGGGFELVINLGFRLIFLGDDIFQEPIFSVLIECNSRKQRYTNGVLDPPSVVLLILLLLGVVGF